MESFKYKGTPEQMQKVADYLLAQGYEWADDDREGEYIHFDKIGGDFFYGVSYDSSVVSIMPASLELAIFGSTNSVTGKVENEWLENTGMPNLKDGTKVDYLMVKGYYCNGKYATSPVETLDWDYTLKSDWTITHWRLHKADEDYFQQPETSEKKPGFHASPERFSVIDMNGKETIFYDKTATNALQPMQFGECFNVPETSSTYTKVDGKVEDHFIVRDVVHATAILTEAAKTIGTRAVERDKGESERSMLSTVNAFNALTKHTLTEEQGWLFMVVLKMARSQGGCFKLDDYLDGAAYFALAGEAAAKGVV